MFAIRTALVRWLESRRVAAELTGLNDRLLADIGLTRSEIDDFAHQAAKAAASKSADPQDAYDTRSERVSRFVAMYAGRLAA